MRVESTPALVLRARDYGESDRIVTLLTRDAGKLAGIAKGAKRSQRRFGGSLGLFAHVTLEFRRRPGAELAFLERATLLQPWRSIVDSLERYAAASHVVEVVDKMTVEEETGDDLYWVVLAALARVDAAEPGPATLRLFELATLAACGYRAELSRCVVCRRPLIGEGAPARVAPASGGVACRRCTAPDADGPILSRGTLDVLARMEEALGERQRSSAHHASRLFASEPAIEARLDRDVAREVAAALAALLAPHLRGRLRASELLAPILGPSER